MNFGSDKVFLYNQPEFEVVSEEEYEHGMSVRYVYISTASDGGGTALCDLSKIRL